MHHHHEQSLGVFAHGLVGDLALGLRVGSSLCHGCDSSYHCRSCFIFKARTNDCAAEKIWICYSQDISHGSASTQSTHIERRIVNIVFGGQRLGNGNNEGGLS
jgi:hypothetical protein